MTTYEKAIYQIVSASYDHLSVEQLFAQLKERYPKIVLASVYNNVNKLCQAGLIRRVSVDGMPDRYDRVQRHDHLVCEGCGRLTDITFDDLSVPLRRAVGNAYLSYDLKIYHLCPACQGQAKEGRKATAGSQRRRENERSEEHG